MTEFEVFKTLPRVLETIGPYLSPRQYTLHNAIGGHGWSISVGHPGRIRCIVKIDDDELATFIGLKIL